MSPNTVHTLRLDPYAAFPFTEQTKHIQKGARLQPVSCTFMLTLDAGDFASFSGFEFFLLLSRVHAYPAPQPAELARELKPLGTWTSISINRKGERN